MNVPADEPSSLLDWATGLVRDPALRSRFAAEPRAVLDEQGLTEVPPADLHHSLPIVTDSVAARMGVDVDASTLTATAQLDGETAVDAITRHLGSVVDVVVSETDTVPDHTTATDPADDPDDDTDPDLDDVDPDHFAPQEMTTMTTSASAAAAHGFNESDWERIETRAEQFGYGDDVDRFIAVANQSDDPFTALFGDGLGDRFWQTHPGPEAHSAPSEHADDVLGDQDTDLDDLDATTDPGSPDADSAEDVRTPGTPQGQHALELEALSHGYPTAEAYVSDTELTGGLRDNGLAWEPQNGSAAYGQLQNYMDAAAAQGLPVGDYAAQNHFTQEQIDAAYADPQAGPVGDSPDQADTDLDSFGESPPAGGDAAYIPHGDDPFMDMVNAGGESPADVSGDVDLDGFGEPATAAGGPVDVRTPGTPQGQAELELEARSHGYPTAEAYVSDAELTGGLRDNGLAWEPQNGSAAYGQLQNYMDAAAAQGLPVGDYAAQNHFTQEQIDAAYADPQAGPVGDSPAQADTDLDSFGESAPAGGDAYIPHGDDPFMDMVDAGGVSPADVGGDVDLDGFGSGSTDAADPSFGASEGGGESFGGGADASGVADDFGSSSDSGSPDDLDSSGGLDGSDDAGSTDDSVPEHADSAAHADSSDDGGSDDGGSDDAGASDGGGESFG